MARTGRPRIEWDEKDHRTFEGLCAIQSTQREVCSVMNVTDKTLNGLLRRYYKMTFSDCFKRFSANGIISLRRKQFEVANNGNVTMLIWLGKQYLGQSDKTEDTFNSSQIDKAHDDLVSAIKELSRAGQ